MFAHLSALVLSRPSALVLPWRTLSTLALQARIPLRALSQIFLNTTLIPITAQCSPRVPLQSERTEAGDAGQSKFIAGLMFLSSFVQVIGLIRVCPYKYRQFRMHVVGSGVGTRFPVMQRPEED